MAPGSAPAGAEASAMLPVPDESAVAAVDPSTSSAVVATVAPATPTASPSSKPDVAVSAAKPVPTAAVGAGNYVVNIGSFSNLDNANALATKLRAANLPVTADRVKLASGNALRLRVGPYADRAAAEAARLRAESVTGGSSKVIVLNADSSARAAPTTALAQTLAPSAPSAVVKPATTAGKPSTPVTSESPKPAAVSAGYAVQLSAPSVEAEALALRDRVRSSGFSSFVQRIETEAGVRFRVRVGPVADRSAAEAMRDAVNGKLGTKGIVVANP